MDRMGYGFAPEVAFLYNPSTTAILKGEAVAWQGAAASIYSMPWPEPDMSQGKKPVLTNQTARSAGVTEPVMGITEATTIPSNISGICGVAMEDITASSWGHVCMGGKCDVRIGISSNIAAGDPLYVTAGGAFIENTTYGTATAVHAIALEAVTTSAVCSAALCSAFVNPGIHGMDPTMNFATA